MSSLNLFSQKTLFFFPSHKTITKPAPYPKKPLTLSYASVSSPSSSSPSPTSLKPPRTPHSHVQEPHVHVHGQGTMKLLPAAKDPPVHGAMRIRIEEKTYLSPVLEAPEVQDQEARPEEDTRLLSEVWQEVQGCNNWEGLLDPMNSHLRREIIRYGEFAQACYDCFDFDPHSKYCGSSKYHGQHFFYKLDMGHCGYEVSRFLYATSDVNLPNFFQDKKLSIVWSTHANWMGYVAVCTDAAEIRRLGRRDILVAWRGTVTYLEWITDLKNILKPAHFRDDPSVKLELGFHELYTRKEEECEYCTFSAREQVLAEIKRLVDYYSGEQISITITGHSLGAALALISAYDLAEMRVNTIEAGQTSRAKANFYNKIPITVFAFSGPRVGNLKFKERCEELGIRVLRVHNTHDKVPSVPGIIANENMKYQKYMEDTLLFPWSYAHVGVELALDHTRSPFLKQTKDLGCAHNLEALLHLVDGYHGKEQRFRTVTKRDVALVNKSCNFLKSEYGVPPNWRQDENKGMVRAENGRWVVPERPRIESHPPDTADHLRKVLNIATTSEDYEHQLDST